jgi:hypothetical protein
MLCKSLNIKIHKTCFYACEIWSLALRKEHRLRIVSISGPKREEVARGWKGLNNEELHNLYDSLNIIMVLKPGGIIWARNVARMGGMRNAYKILAVSRVS